MIQGDRFEFFCFDLLNSLRLSITTPCKIKTNQNNSKANRKQAMAHSTEKILKSKKLSKSKQKNSKRSF